MAFSLDDAERCNTEETEDDPPDRYGPPAEIKGIEH